MDSFANQALVDTGVPIMAAAAACQAIDILRIATAVGTNRSIV